MQVNLRKYFFFRKWWRDPKLFISKSEKYNLKWSWDFRLLMRKQSRKTISLWAALEYFLTIFEMFQVLKQSKLLLQHSKHGHSTDQDSGTGNPSQTPKLRAAAPFGCLWSTVLWFRSFLVMQSKDGNIKAADGERWHTVISYRHKTVRWHKNY